MLVVSQLLNQRSPFLSPRPLSGSRVTLLHLLLFTFLNYSALKPCMINKVNEIDFHSVFLKFIIVNRKIKPKLISLYVVSGCRKHLASLLLVVKRPITKIYRAFGENCCHCKLLRQILWHICDRVFFPKKV